MALTKVKSAGVTSGSFLSSVATSNMPAGSILQVVSNTFTSMDSITNTTADYGISCTITPKVSNSLLMITADLFYSVNYNTGFAFITDSSNNTIQQPPASGSRSRAHYGTHWADQRDYQTYRENHTVFTTHSGTSSQTFKVRVTCASDTTWYTNRNVYNGNRAQDPSGITTMFIQEIAV